ncbi:M15 family metallopeptidase [Nocardioides sp. SYSU DS0663]|uniref:M15 family metallopeptidase n=1 Tax=Nocardioides sp. SYSU DS0663 TaxID=3416445 RepID=UPI003F4B2B48
MRPARSLPPALPTALLVSLALAVPAALAGCSSDAPAPVPPQDPASSSAPAPPPEAPPEPGTVPPRWLGTRVLPEAATGYGEVRPTPPGLRERRFTLPDSVAPLPGSGFASRVVSPAPARVLERSTWEPACPVAADDLAWLRVSFRGFDGERHTGELLAHRTVADDLVQVFRDLWRAGFPLEELRITRPEELDLPPTGDGNNTGAFVCRPITGGTSYSQHAYGLAVDVNPFQNPYLRETPAGRVVLPELASAYLDRTHRRPGMVLEDGPVVRAFQRIGWEWGGDYRTLKDWQHFSATGG